MVKNWGRATFNFHAFTPAHYNFSENFINSVKEP